MHRRHYCNVMLSVEQEDHVVYLHDNEWYGGRTVIFEDLEAANKTYEDLINSLHQVRSLLIERGFARYGDPVKPDDCTDEVYE